MTKEICRYIYRVQVHPSITVGGASVGHCENEVMPGMTVCFEHATKDALAYGYRQALARTTELEQKLKAKTS